MPTAAELDARLLGEAEGRNSGLHYGGKERRARRGEKNVVDGGGGGGGRKGMKEKKTKTGTSTTTMATAAATAATAATAAAATATATALQRSAIHNNASAKSNSRHRTMEVFTPPASPAPTIPPPQVPTDRPPGRRVEPFAKRELLPLPLTAAQDVLPPLFAEQPRPAPLPPSRPPLSAIALPAATSLSTRARTQERPEQSQSSSVEPPMRGTPSLQATLPLRTFQASQPIVQSLRDTSGNTHDVMSSASSNVDNHNSFIAAPQPAARAEPVHTPSTHHTSLLPGRPLQVPSQQSAPPLVRASTAPPTFNRKKGTASGKTSRRLGSSNANSRRNKAKFRLGGARRSLDGHQTYRNPAAASIRSALWGLEVVGGVKARSDAIAKSAGSRTPNSTQARSTRKFKGETVSMLVDTGFFPVKELIYGEASTVSRLRESQMYRVNLPPRLSFIDAPGTPSSPMTRSKCSPVSPRRAYCARKRGSGMVGRDPLSQISENRMEAPSHRADLAAIAECTVNDENVAPEMRQSVIPATTQIYLRGGSIVTATPPEATAWRRSVYVHGPIQLPQPAIVPRKNSVASLEPFQEVVDELYQHALAVPRRRSDDAAVDDVCDFFDDFGFGAISFDGDCLAVRDMRLDEGLEEEEEEEAEASPLEVVVAKEVLDGAAKLQRTSAAPMPPVETEETLRARGIARLSKGSSGSRRKESLTPVAAGEGEGEGVQEMISGSSAWAELMPAPAAATKAPRMSKSSRHPIARIRRML